MGTSRTTTERQIQLAKDELQARVTALQAAGKSAEAFKTDPKWREAAAKVRQLVARLRRVEQTEKLNVEVARLKAEKLAAPPKQKPVKVKKAKAEKKPEAAPKKEGGPKKDKGGKK